MYIACSTVLGCLLFFIHQPFLSILTYATEAIFVGKNCNGIKIYTMCELLCFHDCCNENRNICGLSVDSDHN
jgi:hypothetical protein